MELSIWEQGEADTAYSRMFTRREPEGYHMEIRQGEEHIVQAYDGTEGWVAVLSDDSLKMPIGPAAIDELRSIVESTINFTADNHLESKYISSEYVGTAMLDGVKMHKLAIVMREKELNGFQYIDTKAHLTRQIVTEFSAGGQSFTGTMYLEDYTDFDGILMPCRTRFVVSGEPILLMIFKLIELNPKLPEGAFTQP